jgi:hypothetical protein
MLQIGKFASGFQETSNQMDLFDYFELGCSLDSIVHLSQLKTFQLNRFFKLEILLVEFEKLQNLVELNLFKCSKLGCLPDSIVHLS